MGVVGHGLPGNLVNNAMEDGDNVYNLNDAWGSFFVST